MGCLMLLDYFQWIMKMCLIDLVVETLVGVFLNSIQKLKWYLTNLDQLGFL